VTLLVDIGNSRVKWARLRGAEPDQQLAAAYRDWLPEDWRRALFGPGPAARVLVATTAGAGPLAALREAARLSGSGAPERVESTAEALGVRNGYRDPRQLGVDRWLAILAGHRLAPRGACVVDVGTAMTVDAVDAAGRHLGGVIVPGPALMRSALHTGTRDLAELWARPGGEGTGLFADNTRDAIDRGCAHALAALVERSLARLEARGVEAPTLLLTGGAAAALVPFLATAGRTVPDLVLRGLAALAGPEAGNPGGGPGSQERGRDRV